MSRLLAGHLLQRLQLTPMRCIPASSLELRLHVQADMYVRMRSYVRYWQFPRTRGKTYLCVASRASELVTEGLELRT